MRSTLEGHPAGGRADYHDLGVFWKQNPVLELSALSGRPISRQNALASSRRQVNYATDWPASCIIQLVGWGVAFLWPGPSTRDPPGQPAGSHLEAPAGQPDGQGEPCIASGVCVPGLQGGVRRQCGFDRSGAAAPQKTVKSRDSPACRSPKGTQCQTHGAKKCEAP